jgi:hypothetical protein
MEESLEIAKYVLPSIVVLITAYLLIKSFLHSQEEIKKKELQTKIEELKTKIKQQDKQYLQPIRLQAYERMLLFVERISPHSLVFRVQKPGQKVFQLQSALLKSIRDEYEHNLAQQLYITNESWSMLRSAKEEVVKLINIAAADLQPDDNAIALSTRIFELSLGVEKQNTERAIDMLKRDIQKMF